MGTFRLSNSKEHEAGDECLTCALVAARDRGAAPDWDAIYRTAHWDIVHALNSHLLGWICIVTRKHHHAIADVEARAMAEVGTLIHDVSTALAEIVGCERTYVMQFGEAPGHAHVHFHVVPRPHDIPESHKGANAFGYLGASESERVPEAEMNAFALKLRAALAE